MGDPFAAPGTWVASTLGGAFDPDDPFAPAPLDGTRVPPPLWHSAYLSRTRTETYHGCAHSYLEHGMTEKKFSKEGLLLHLFYLNCKKTIHQGISTNFP